MNILWLSWKDITHPDSGGAEQSGQEHAKAWIAAGHSVHWVSTHYVGSNIYDQRDGVTFQHIGAKWMWFTGLIHILFAIKYLTDWKKSYDLVVDEIHGPPFLTPLYVKKPILALIHEVAGEIWQKTVPFPISWLAQHMVEPLFFKFYKNTPFIVGAETTQDDLIKVGIPKENIHYIPYGVTIPESLPHFEKEPTPTVIFLSSIRPVKGLDRVYEAFKKIKSHIPELQLWVVGDYSIPYGQQIKRKIESEVYRNAITIFGKVNQEKKFELLQRAHILVHGSYKEGWGLVVIEANLVATPAVVYDVAGLRNSIKHSETGYIAQNEEEYIGYIEKCLNGGKEYEKLRMKALRWSRTFSWNNSTKQSLELINKITS